MELSWHLALWRHAQLVRLSLLVAACEAWPDEVPRAFDNFSIVFPDLHSDGRFSRWVADELWRLRHAPALPRIACRDCGASPATGAALYRLPGPDRTHVCEAHLRTSLRGRERLRVLDKR